MAKLDEKHKTILAKLDGIENQANNIKMATYFNVAALLILLAFMFGIVLKQLGF